MRHWSKLQRNKEEAALGAASSWIDAIAMGLAEVAVFIFPLFGCIEIDIDGRALIGAGSCVFGIQNKSQNQDSSDNDADDE